MLKDGVLDLLRRLDRHFSKRAFHRELRDLLEREAIDVVLDVGAHKGEYGSRLRDLGYRGRIVSFEPLQENADVIRAGARDDPDWEVRCTAIGSETGELPLRIAGKTDFSSLRTVSEYGRSDWEAETEVQDVRRVPVRRLDEVWSDCVEGPARPDSPRIFLKIDTQGFEREVIEGAGNKLGEVRALQLEVPVRPIYEGAASYGELFRLLDDRGFVPVALFPFSRDDVGRVVEVDCLMVPRPA